MSELVSIIVPIYNCEKYLDACIKSLTGQSYSNVEIILVDDGSTDGSGSICDGHAGGDSRVRVLHKRNGGVAAARNDGIDAADGKYLMFVDSDDYLHEDAVQVLYDALQRDGADMSTFCTAVIAKDKDFALDAAMSNRPLNLEGPHTGIEICREYLERESLLTSVVWGKLYKSELFDDELRYDTSHDFEDTRLLPDVYLKCNTITCVPGDYYYYRQREGSIMHADYTPRRYCEFVDSRIYKINAFYNAGLSDASYTYERRLIELLMAYFEAKLEHRLDADEKAKWRPEYERRKAWFEAQEWFAHNKKTTLNLRKPQL